MFSLSLNKKEHYRLQPERNPMKWHNFIHDHQGSRIAVQMTTVLLSGIYQPSFCDIYVKSSLQLWKGEWPPSEVPYWTVIFSIGIPSQTAEEASCTTTVLNWTGTQSVLHDHMHTSPHSCTTNQTLQLLEYWVILLLLVPIAETLVVVPHHWE